MPLIVIWDYFVELFHKNRPFRPRPHETHLTLNDVDELRQFIQAEPSNDLAHARDSRIALQSPLGAVLFLRVGTHGTELQDFEGAPSITDSCLAVEYRPFGV